MLKSPHGTFYMHIQILIDDYTGDGEQAITRLKYQCANLNFSDQSRYNILFQHAIKKEESQKSIMPRDFKVLGL